MNSRNDAGDGHAPSTTRPPRTNPTLLGHEATEAMLLRLYRAGRLPHAILLTGLRGIGKATLAFRLARFVLAGDAPGLGLDAEGLAISPESGTFRRVAASGHADLLTVERTYDPRRRRMRSEIVVDDVREIAAFLRLTAAEGGWRVVVVDGADEMNRNAANALLKILEEPPQRALLLLVAHSPGRLLPTIRSRCQRLALSPLPPDIIRRLLGLYRPDLPDAQRETLVALCRGSIGRAIELAAVGGVELREAVLGLLSRDAGIETAALHAFADRLVRADAEDAYRAVEELILQTLTSLAVTAAGGAADLPEHAALRRLSERVPAARWAELRDEIKGGFTRTDDLNLDKKQTILSAFFAIDAIAR